MKRILKQVGRRVGMQLTSSHFQIYDLLLVGPIHLEEAEIHAKFGAKWTDFI